MKSVTSLSSCASDTPERRRKSAEKLISGVLEDADFIDVLRAVAFRFKPVHIQSAQTKTIARFLGKDEETIRRWLHDVTRPKAKDVWPLFFVVILSELPIETQRHVVEVLMGLADE